MATNQDKLSNIIGAPFTDYVLRQLANRAYRSSNRGPDGALKLKSNDEVLYLANKTAWARLISSVDLSFPTNSNETPNTFASKLGILDTQTANGALGSPGTGVYSSGDSLAKNWILQAGTSIQNGNGINLRQGLGLNGAYGLGGTQELGYRPMPGLTSVRIETMGRLGSLRQATINFKVWNMNQLNTIEALYFRLGYSMILEWGHTQYFRNQDGSVIVPGGTFVQQGVFGIENPFDPNLRKEDIQRKITIKREETSGNYDGMLGIVTNFNWAYNQEGGYDCILRVVGLGAVMDSMRVNQIYKLPDGTIKRYKGASSALKSYVERQLAAIAAARARAEQAAAQAAAAAGGGGIGTPPKNLEELRQKLITYDGFSPVVTLTSGTADDFRDIYGIRSYRDILGENNYFDYFGAFTNGSNVYSLAAQREFTGLYLRSRAGNSSPTGLVFIPDPSKAPAKVTLNEPVLRAFATQAKDFDYLNTNGNRTGETRPLSPPVSIFNLDFAKPAPGTTQVGSLIGYLVGIREQRVRVKGTTGDKFESADVFVPEYYYVQPDEEILGENAKGKITVKQNLRRPGGGTQEVYLTLEYTIVSNPLPGFAPSPKEVVTAVSTWSRNPVLDLTAIDFKKNSLTVTITGKVSLPIVSRYKGPTVVNGVTVTPQSLTTVTPGARIENGVAVVDAILDLTLITNNPGFIEGLATPPPAPASQTATGTGNAGDVEGTVQTVTSDQEDPSVGFSSALHAMLTVVESTSQEVATKVGKKAKYEGRIVPVELKGVTSDFYKDGIFKDVLGTPKPLPLDGAGVPTFDLTAFAQKGFASELMSNYAKYGKIPYVGGTTNPASYIESKFFKSIVIKYKQNNLDNIVYPGQWPVYISLGYLLSFINNMCLFYDSKTPQSANGQTGGNDNRPYIYIDFNPETNFCLTSPQQFSIDPQICLVPANLNQTEYLNLFPQQTKPTLPFSPTESNSVSQALDAEGFDFKDSNPYRGKIMNILLTTQYLINTLRDFTTADPQHAVNLHPFLERIMSDINKCLGGVNLFRVAYRDDTNTVQILDDQYVPPLTDEPTMIERTEFLSNLKTNVIESGQLPIFGTVVAGPNGQQISLPTLGIAREMQFKTVMSTKMASMLAISAQATTESVNAKDHSELSYLNQTYKDRYKPYIKDQTQGQSGTNINVVAGTQQRDTTQPRSNDQDAANRFNEHVKSIYAGLDFVSDKVDSSKNYYIERMSKVKSTDDITTAAPFIPAELELAIDGISGIIMGNAFTIPKERLPLSLREQITDKDPDGQPRVGFIVNGLTHTIENNEWLTRIKGQMIKLRTQTTLGRTVPVFAAVQTGILPDTATVSTAGGSATSDRNDPNNPCYVRPFELQAGRVDKLSATGKKREGILAWREAFPAGTTKGLKALLEAQTNHEGFFPAYGGNPASKSWRTNNPGNIGNTDDGSIRTYPTLSAGVQAQIDRVNTIISGNTSSYPKDTKLYDYISRYAPTCYRPKGSSLYIRSTNDPISYTNAIIAYAKGEYGIDITADMTLSQIISKN